MTTKEVCERLSREFPGKSVSFQVECWSHGNTNRTECEVCIWERNIGNIGCESLDDGIRKLKLALGMVDAVGCEVPQ